MSTLKVGQILSDKIGHYYVKKIINHDGYPCPIMHKLSKYSLLRRIELLILRLRYK